MRRRDADAVRWQKQVESACAEKGLHLTPLRQQVLTILAESSAPLGAYAIIDQLSRLEGKPVAPPTVYRTLDFFLSPGFIYKIESRNAYAPCEHIGHAHHGALLLCEKCGRSDEIEDVKLDRLLRKQPPAPALRRTGRWSSSWACAGTARPEAASALIAARR